MHFKDWLNENEYVVIRDALLHEIPKLFIHRTENKKDALSIQKYGFNLKKFGRTGKKTRQFSLCQFDPKGVYAIDINSPNDELNSYDSRPYVIFTANISKALLIEEKTFVNAKLCLSKYFNFNTGGKLTNMLLKRGYQAVIRPDSEQIILDPKIITIIKIGNV